MGWQYSTRTGGERGLCSAAGGTPGSDGPVGPQKSRLVGM